MLLLAAATVLAEEALAVDVASDRTSFTAPLAVRNLYPPMMRFFDPRPDSALRPYRSGWQLSLDQHLATVNMIETQPSGQLLVDMELYMLEASLSHALTDRLEVTLRAPILLPGGGVFDAAIQRFHRQFGFPNGGRELRPNNVFAYHVDLGGGRGWHGRSQPEMGNVTVVGRDQLARGEGWGWDALAAVKLPTASVARGWGSGAADLAVGSRGSWTQRAWGVHLEGWLVQPMSRVSSGIGVARYLRGSLALSYLWMPKLVGVVQVQGGGSPYRSGFTTLDQAPFLISFGLRGRADDWEWSGAVVENITQQTTQDISIMFGLRWILH